MKFSASKRLLPIDSLPIAAQDAILTHQMGNLLMCHIGWRSEAEFICQIIFPEVLFILFYRRHSKYNRA
jgi:hypothetical protein